MSRCAATMAWSEGDLQERCAMTSRVSGRTMKSKHEGNEEHDSFSGQKKDRGQLGRHWSKSGELKCNECEYSSDRKLSLKFHYESVHLEIRKFF